MSLLPTRTRILCVAFAALFTLGAAVQWNDPDPLPWMVTYGFAAGLAAAAAYERLWPRVTALFALGMALWLFALAPSLMGAPPEAFTSFRMQDRSHEEPREAGGLALLAIWNAFLAHRGRMATRRRRESDASDTKAEW